MTIGLVYAALLALGVAYAVVTSIFGWLGDHDLGGHVGGADAGHSSPISGTVLATFITGFGGGGTVAHHLLRWTLVPGLLAASVSGLVLAGAAFLLLELLFSRTQAGSEFTVGEAVGRPAEVITAIPRDGIGEIAYSVRGKREVASARTLDGSAVGRGRPVVIDRMSGTTAYVRISD